MMQKKCPVCGSLEIKIIDQEGTAYIQCLKCKFNEMDEYDIYPEERTAKSSGGSPYKRGGSLRTQKRS